MYAVERDVPGRRHAADLRLEQAAIALLGLSERRALHAELAAIRGVLGVTVDGDEPDGITARADAAADAAVGTGCARFSHARAVRAA